MRKKYLLFIFINILLTNLVWAYPKKSINITDYEYRRYVRPQLRSINQDYHTLLILLNPEFKPIKGAFRDARQILKEQIKLKDNCNQAQMKDCIKKLKIIQKHLSELENSIQKGVNLSKKDYLTIDEKIKAKHLFTNFKNELISTQTSLDNLLLESTLTNKNNLFVRDIKSKIDKVIKTFHIFITEASDNRFRNDLNGYWNNFILPVYKYVLVQDQKEFIIDNITELNIRWNSLNVRITKRNKKVSKQIKTLVGIMHNRWNNILKVSLDPMKY